MDVCLIPEVNFAVDGEHGLMAYLKQLLAEKGHCVICVAEGAGQVLLLLHTSLLPTSMHEKWEALMALWCSKLCRCSIIRGLLAMLCWVGSPSSCVHCSTAV